MSKENPTVKHDRTITWFILGAMVLLSLFTVIILLGIF